MPFLQRQPPFPSTTLNVRSLHLLHFRRDEMEGEFSCRVGGGVGALTVWMENGSAVEHPAVFSQRTLCHPWLRVHCLSGEICDRQFATCPQGPASPGRAAHGVCWLKALAEMALVLVLFPGRSLGAPGHCGCLSCGAEQAGQGWWHS